jgi:hypothetical protein
MTGSQEQHLDQHQQHQQHCHQEQEGQEVGHQEQQQQHLAPGHHHRSLRESFRKLVRPLVKRRGDLGDAEDSTNSTDDETGSLWRDFSRRNSRRDSRQSAGGGRHQTPEHQGGGNRSGSGSFRLHGRLRRDDQRDGSFAEESLTATAVEEEDRHSSVPVDSKWKKILGISLAISRYIVLPRKSASILF